MEWEQDISMFDWFFTPNNTSSKVIAITIGTIKYCYNIFLIKSIKQRNFIWLNENKNKIILFLFGEIKWSEFVWVDWPFNQIFDLN